MIIVLPFDYFGGCTLKEKIQKTSKKVHEVTKNLERQAGLRNRDSK
jgi:hypothetical protein